MSRLIYYFYSGPPHKKYKKGHVVQPEAKPSQLKVKFIKYDNMAEPWVVRVSGKMQKETHNASSKRNSAAINKMD